MALKPLVGIPGAAGSMGIVDDDAGGAVTVGMLNTAIANHAALAAGVHKTVALGLLDMAGGAWIGVHPGFADAVIDNGPGDFTTHLSADGAPATMFARCNTNSSHVGSAMAGPLGGVGNRDLRVLCTTFEGAPSNPPGWGAGAVLGAAVVKDQIVLIEVLDFA